MKIILFSLIDKTINFIIDVQPYMEECFSTHLKKGEKFNLGYDVTFGGNEKIDFYVF